MMLYSFLTFLMFGASNFLFPCCAHTETRFQDRHSILNQGDLSKPFPLKSKHLLKYKYALSTNHIFINGDKTKLKNNNLVNATLYPDKETLQDGDCLEIVVEVSGAVPSENDYLSIQCGNAINEEDIIDAVSPIHLESSRAIFELQELTYLRCDYTFSYIHVDENGMKDMIGKLTIPSVDLPTTPKQPHLVYGGTPTKMKVMYVSSSPFPYPSVKYWQLNESEDMSRISIGTSETYTENDMCEDPANQVAQNLFRDPGYTHTIEMENLIPSTMYAYRVGNHEHGWSNILDFRSAPDSSQPIRFVAFGDQDIREPSKNTSYYVKKEVEDNGSQFTLHFGDLGYGRGKGWVWDRWGSMVSPGAAIAPYMVTVGNHELDHVRGNDPSGEEPFNPWWWNNGRHASNGECGVPTFVRWGSAMPDDGHGGGGHKMWYSFDWGNTHIVMMDSEHDWRYGSHQHTWLEEDLAAVDRSVTPWIVVTSHRPIYTTQLCEFFDWIVSTQMRQALDPLFEKYKVNLALVAHTHAYERTCQIIRGECVEQGGTQHITVGSAGASLESCGDSPIFGPYSREGTNQYGYLRVEASAETMKLEFVLDEDGSVWDSYEVYPWN